MVGMERPKHSVVARCRKCIRSDIVTKSDGNLHRLRLRCMVGGIGPLAHTRKKQEMTNAPFITGIVVAALAVTATATLAFGPGAGGDRAQMNFQELDSNGDGEITQSEMTARSAARFTGADADGDGLLSRSEMEAQGQKRVADRVAGMIERFDKDGDGALSQEEMPKPRRAGKMFERFDLDSSGGISEQEFSEAREDMRGRMGGKWGKHKDCN